MPVTPLKRVVLTRAMSSSAATKIVRFLDAYGNERIGQEPAPGTQQSQLITGKDIFGSKALTSQFAEVRRVLAPFVPTQIIGIGLNYRNHAKETNMPIPNFPVVFYKNINSVADPETSIVLPKREGTHVDYECELAVVLKAPCKDVSVQDALKFVAGDTCANDISARRWQGNAMGGGQWCRAKSFDTFCPLGPVLVTPEGIPDPQNLTIETILNDVVVQRSNTKDMVFSVAELISQLSQDTTLPAGTVILTGTPEGVGFTRKPPIYLKPGDKVEIRIQHIGSLLNYVIGASSL
ncbi:hypothetical protein DYB37_000587 [Aphanomyces astaci]|uniref:Fumarylacetoacetase-like C-terminal domain-containing protein n=1 Tax=Aphanomyces astaci TaxID=112090 RepID=A0A3R6XRH4_APHAT|nr:hypothetical protein DYB37_000587 [Aphanomyces astaci]